MRIAKLIFGVVAAVGIVGLAWDPNPDAFQRWLITGIMTLTALKVVLDDLSEFLSR